MHQDRLFSASSDGLIEVWNVKTLNVLFTLQGYNQPTGLNPQQCSQCLAVSGRKLISGSVTVAPDPNKAELRVWDLETMHQEHAKTDFWNAVPETVAFNALAAVGAEVWGGLDGSLVVWGRKK